MNATPHRLPGRHAALSPFDIQVTPTAPRPPTPARSGHYGESCPIGTDQDAGYGCVEWYQYSGARADATRAKDSASPADE